LRRRNFVFEDFSMTFVSHKKPDPVVAGNGVIDDPGSAVLEDHDAVAFVLVNLVILNEWNRGDADDAVVLEKEQICRYIFVD
jgi:hypothetical protein